MRYWENGGFDHIRVIRQHLFDLRRCDLLASPVDDIRDAADNEQITVRVQVSEVAGSKPTVPKSGRRCGRIIVVSPRYGGAPQHDLSAFAG
jgi:hypothetical protein